MSATRRNRYLLAIRSNDPIILNPLNGGVIAQDEFVVIYLRMKRYLLLVFLPAILASCSNTYPPIDPDFSFNIVRSVNFQIPNGAGTGLDTSLIVPGHIDTLKDYDTAGTRAYLLRTAEIWRCYLHSNTEGFSLDRLDFARVLIGSDTIAFDSIPQFAADPYELSVTKKDITKLMQDTSFKATLQCKFNTAPTSPVSITCGMTVIYTAASSTLSQ